MEEGQKTCMHCAKPKSCLQSAQEEQKSPLASDESQSSTNCVCILQLPAYTVIPEGTCARIRPHLRCGTRFLTASANMRAAVLVLALGLASQLAQAFYLPGVAPQDFKKVRTTRGSSCRFALVTTSRPLMARVLPSNATAPHDV